MSTRSFIPTIDMVEAGTSARGRSALDPRAHHLGPVLGHQRGPLSLAQLRGGFFPSDSDSVHIGIGNPYLVQTSEMHAVAPLARQAGFAHDLDSSERRLPERQCRVDVRLLTLPCTKLGCDVTLRARASNLVLVDNKLRSRGSDQRRAREPPTSPR